MDVAEGPEGPRLWLVEEGRSGVATGHDGLDGKIDVGSYKKMEGGSRNVEVREQDEGGACVGGS